MTITGTVVYQNLEGGFWGIIDSSGKQYFPINLPEQLKYEGKSVRVVASTIDDDMGISMWGTSIRIVSFETIRP
ncbi:MAG: hypothetical protein HRU40_09875 [Saprospiraceae bacterium]|nr:hypothetical protein [Saprospiraceae bacterium]